MLSPLFVCSRLGSEVTIWPIGSKQPSPAAASALARATDLDVDTREPCHLPDQCRVAASPKASSCFHFLFLGPCRHRWTIGDGKHYSGTYRQTYDCLVASPTVVNVGMLNITGVASASLPSMLPRIWKLTSHESKFRLFTVIEGGQLVLNKVILTGGDVEKVIGSEFSWGGGAIYASGPSTTVAIFDSILYNNRAYAGGSIYASNQTSIVVKTPALAASRLRTLEVQCGVDIQEQHARSPVRIVDS